MGPYKNILNLLKENKYFSIPFLIFILAGGLLMLLVIEDEFTCCIYFNLPPAIYHFFYFITVLGGGIYVIVFSLLFLFIRIRYFLIVGLSTLLTGLLIQFLKKV